MPTNHAVQMQDGAVHTNHCAERFLPMAAWQLSPTTPGLM
jgi:hypothetical protein